MILLMLIWWFGFTCLKPFASRRRLWTYHKCLKVRLVIFNEIFLLLEEKKPPQIQTLEWNLLKCWEEGAQGQAGVRNGGVRLRLEAGVGEWGLQMESGTSNLRTEDNVWVQQSENTTNTGTLRPLVMSWLRAGVQIIRVPRGWGRGGMSTQTHLQRIYCKSYGRIIQTGKVPLWCLRLMC